MLSVILIVRLMVRWLTLSPVVIIVSVSFRKDSMMARMTSVT